ncbi:MAG: protein translocase subunit SecD [Buchnera aphidicola (Nurudea shiraii)]
MLIRSSEFRLFLIAMILLLGLIYAAPNLFQNTLSIHIYFKESSNISHIRILKVFDILKNEKIKYIAFKKRDKDAFLFFDQINEQLRAYEKLRKAFLKDKGSVFFDFNADYPNIFKIFNAKPARLGLDLKGGTYFLLKVSSNYILEQCQKNIIKYFLNYSFNNDYKGLKIEKIQNYGIRLSASKFSILDRVQNDINLNYPDVSLSRTADGFLYIDFSKKYLKSAMKSVIHRNIYILKSRIHQLGIGEPIVQQQSFDSIIVELPGFNDNLQVKEILSSNTMIEFHLVNNNYKGISILKNTNYIPNSSKLYWIDSDNPILLYKSAFITGEHIIDSSYLINDLNQIEVNVILSREGGKIMSDITKNNIGEYLAILLLEHVGSTHGINNKNVYLEKKESVLNVAKINSILDSSFRIVGIRSIPEAKKLSILLKTGSFLSPVQVVKETVIGSSVGRNNMKNGILSCIISIILCILIMIIRYKKFGIIASIALVSNLLLIIAIVSILPGIVLTMPGISSILLMLAFSIDSNVLINERIREEIRNNIYIREAINRGYIRAYYSIFDANVTMLIISIVLYIIGTDIIKNFAIISMVGIFTSLFSSLLVTRTIIQVFYSGKRIKNLFM